MFKLLRTVLTLGLVACLLPACSRKQSPTPTDTVSSGGFNSNQSQNDILGGMGTEGSWGTDPDMGLSPRDGTGFGEPGMFNGQTMVPGLLDDVYFGFDSSAISASERSKLQAAADYLASNPNDNLLIEGYCDWYGTAEYNLALGDRRANSAKDYLITLGVSPDRVETLSKGSLEAISGLSKSESAQDRRAELIVLQ